MSAWQIVQPGGFGASLEDELFAELDREEQQHRKKPLESDSDEDSEEEEGNKQPWTHLCVLDFEACREELESKSEWLYEITELPVTLLNCTTLKVPPPFMLYYIHLFIFRILILPARTGGGKVSSVLPSREDHARSAAALRRSQVRGHGPGRSTRSPHQPCRALDPSSRMCGAVLKGLARRCGEPADGTTRPGAMAAREGPPGRQCG